MTVTTEGSVDMERFFSVTNILSLKKKQTCKEPFTFSPTLLSILLPPSLLVFCMFYPIFYDW